MPRVHTRTKTTRGKKTYRCSSCGKDIEPGQGYYYWTRRFGRSGQTYYQHQACGYPRPTQLSSRKTAVVEEAISNAQNEISGWSWELPSEVTRETHAGESVEVETDDLDAIVEMVAESAREVAQEYEDGVQNLPENFQQAPTGEAMTAVAEELNSWADDLDDWSSSANTSIELPSSEEYEDDDEWREKAEELAQEVASEMQSAANEAFDGMPEYQG